MLDAQKEQHSYDNFSNKLCHLYLGFLGYDICCKCHNRCYYKILDKVNDSTEHFYIWELHIIHIDFII